MADDAEEFIQEHGIRLPTLIGHSMSVSERAISFDLAKLKQERGAKVAMTVALRSPRLLGTLIAVDNAPVDANLKSSFHQYVQGLREIEEAKVKKQADADEVLQRYEMVGWTKEGKAVANVANTGFLSHSPYGSSFSQTLFDHQMVNSCVFASPSSLSLPVWIRWATSHTKIQTKPTMMDQPWSFAVQRVTI